MKPENALAIFKSKAKSFDQSPSRMDNQTSSHKQENPKKLKMKPLKPCKLTAIEANIFGEALVANSLTAEHTLQASLLPIKNYHWTPATQSQQIGY
ncbi:hypothetical protein PGT21_013067 [Puccinia graminis f. sp. tritici]|uniref:Uncharacterized protein n=1 Tax=Puccinia graminis f. sp. tritici TaxID=56615 RepID=A0A5B0PVG7_PUCGR|nr:hypothetical protein PGT21_013067 [Puccinia graminis f. sp. tritici]KAA1104943.1 hypothetical protein PGTUg99_005326 [Puccinia graminis f. sp. tritici]KAA1112368.1 hypothetical protein PGTUg99_011597 [Puccinia graminis f. sp. tritici]